MLCTFQLYSQNLDQISTNCICHDMASQPMSNYCTATDFPAEYIIIVHYAIHMKQ